ncbi:MAG: hypothetical protein BWY31_01583 [Lentisphaerae bacterium ADurb.Bin242]|nr:MAG: hypothetical protein BWY31_01583 [Lentisphaerae bacterium ADurb.Bin242]
MVSSYRKNSTCRRYEMDVERFPAVVFESDDWGSCEWLPDRKALDAARQTIRKTAPFSMSRLEKACDLNRLFGVLEKYRGLDSLNPVFTAFTCMGNPDFEFIRARGFTEYRDIPIDRGFPPPWDGSGAVGAMRDGMERGVWSPEYHAMLHHTSPREWLRLLNGSGADSENARRLFELHAFGQGRHIPEYNGYNVREQNDFIATGLRRFQDTFGVLPSAAVTSDAFPETVVLWAANGIRIVSIINCRINSGETVVYDTKPWNFQDTYAKIGDYDPMLDVVYLTRNAFFEADASDKARFGVSGGELMKVVERNFKVHEEPCVISTHRAVYVSFDAARETARFAELENLLARLEKRGVFFLTTSELGALYRQGWSLRSFGKKRIFRKWAECEIPPGFEKGLELPSLKEVSIREKSVGNYLVAGGAECS